MAAPVRLRCCCRLIANSPQKIFLRGHQHTIRSSPRVYPKVPSQQLSEAQRAAVAAAELNSQLEDFEKIEIPKRKKRDELSVLKALASTVEQDYSAPHYKYLDDPFLIPNSALEKRSYALAKASGKRAAQYVVQNYPAYFVHNPAEPSIEKFMPPAGAQKAEDSEEGLRERIQLRQPAAAFQSYQKIRETGQTVSDDVCAELLELLCVYNSQDMPKHLLPDEQYFHQDTGQDRSRRIAKTWVDDGAAEQMFAQLEQKDARMYCSMIRGRAKYLQIDGAYDLYQEIKDKNMPISVETYNAVLRIVGFMKDATEERWELAKSVLRDIERAGVQPDVQTFNSLLYLLFKNRRYQQCTKWAVQTLSEMKACSVEPSLTTWFYLLQIFFSNQESQSNILSEIMKHLQGQDLKLQEATDYDFFFIAMTKCFVNLQDLELGYQIDALLNYGNNILLLGDSYRESIYYTQFLRLVCMFEQIDTVMELYERITPHLYTPTFTAMDDLLKAIELNDGYRYLPHIWSDLVLFGYTRRQDLVEAVLSSMASKPQEPQLQELFVQIADQVLTQMEEEASNTRLARPLRMNGALAGHMMLIHLNAGNLDKCWEIFDFFQTNRLRMEKFPSEASMTKLIEICIECQDTEKAMQCLVVMADYPYHNLEDMISKVQDKFTLSDEQISIINAL